MSICGNINKLEKMKRPWVVAHRGYSGRYPENTSSSFEAAIRADADMIELDVCMTKDRVPVVIHDKTLERTTDGHGLVSELKLSELKTIDIVAKQWRDTINGNSYFSSKVTLNYGLNNEKLIELPFHIELELIKLSLIK